MASTVFKVSGNALKLREVMTREVPPGPPRTFSALARVLGVTRQAVTNWVAGRCKPEPVHQRKMEELYGLRKEDW